MNQSTVQKSRRNFVKQAVAATGIPFFYGPWSYNRVNASKADKPIKIGLTHDASGQYGVSGQSDLRGCITAIEEANLNGGVLGRRVEYIHADTRTDPRTARQVAERFIQQHEVSFLAGAVHSNVATSIANVAQQVGCVYLNTNSSSPLQASEDCHRVKFVFDANSTNFAKASTKYAINEYGSRWIILANDYEWGIESAKAIKAMAESFGAEIIDTILLPVGTRNYIGVLKKIKAMSPQVVATAIGGNDYIPLRAQVVDMGLNHSPIWVNNQQDWPDHYASTEASILGIFGTTWYHCLDLPGVKEFVRKYRQRWPQSDIKAPGNVYYNGYMAIRELLSAIERSGSTSSHGVIRELEELKISSTSRMQHTNAYMNPLSHHLQQTVYVASSNRRQDLKNEDDFYKILHWLEPGEIEDHSEQHCRLESLDDTPVYDI